MSRHRQNRRAVRWARYFNHYGHIPEVFLGGWSANRVIWSSMRQRRYAFLYVRRQAKHRFGEGRAS